MADGTEFIFRSQDLKFSFVSCVCICKDCWTCARGGIPSSPSGVAMGRRKCSSFSVYFLVDDSLVLFSFLLFHVDEEQRDSPGGQVLWGFL